MKADDRTMTLLTGIVLTIGVGTLAQNSDAIMTAFGAKPSTATADDSFTVRAGKTQTLDVLANDPAGGKAQEIRIVEGPACGKILNAGLSLEYSDSGDCAGEVTVIYCIEQEEVCEDTSVTLNVIGAPAPRKDDPVVASARPETVAPQPPQPKVQPQRPSMAKAEPADPEPAPGTVDDIRLAVLSALDRPVETSLTPPPVDNEEEAVPSARNTPAPLLPETQILPPSFLIAEPEPVASVPAPQAVPDPLAPDNLTLAAIVPEAREDMLEFDPPPPGGPEQDGPAQTSVKRVSTPDLGIVSAALIMLPSTQDRIGNRVGEASHTDDLAALQTDSHFVASMDADQAAAAPPPIVTAALTSTPPPVAQAPAPEAPAAALCPVSVDLTVSAGATLRAAIDASCNAGERITIAHAGIRFSARIGADGRALVEFPAVTHEAKVSVIFADGTERGAQVTVPDLDRYMRVAVTWDGSADLDLHALEFGANAGDRGHVWAGTPRSYRESRRFGGGYLTVLGLGTGKGPQAEIYTLALFRRADSGLVEMSLSLAGDAPCNQNFAIQAVRSDNRHAATIRELRFKVTDCDRRSEPVFIANALEDLRVASRW